MNHILIHQTTYESYVNSSAYGVLLEKNRAHWCFCQWPRTVCVVFIMGRFQPVKTCFPIAFCWVTHSSSCRTLPLSCEIPTPCLFLYFYMLHTVMKKGCWEGGEENANRGQLKKDSMEEGGGYCVASSYKKKVCKDNYRAFQPKSWPPSMHSN